MATVITRRYDPFAEMVSLRQAMDRLFEDSFVRPGAGISPSSNLALDVRETDEAYIVEAAVPGFEPEQVEITITGDVLTIKGNVESEDETKEGTYLLRERRVQNFARSIRIPEAVTADKAEATFQNGILTLNIPKAEEVRPKVITVKAK